jgi:hypothetical protein
VAVDAGGQTGRAIDTAVAAPPRTRHAPAPRAPQVVESDHNQTQP